RVCWRPDPYILSRNETALTALYTLSLHDALPICKPLPPVLPNRSFLFQMASKINRLPKALLQPPQVYLRSGYCGRCQDRGIAVRDRKSTRLNSSHVKISYAVFCWKEKNNRNVYLQ